MYWKYGRDLPDHTQLRDYEPPVTTRLYAGDGQLLAEFASESRVFVGIDRIPDHVKHAFISAEDKNFYRHGGIDGVALLRALYTNLAERVQGGGRLVGASTITQQVAKNFLLTNQRTLVRKFQEAIIARRIESVLEKDRILELYLNQIYLGQRAYGVGAAALRYFDKSLDNLTLAESAYLAALPKAPNNYHPRLSRAAALSRRDWVLARMLENAYISTDQYEKARIEPLIGSVQRRNVVTARADYFVEEVRRDLIERFSESTVYEGGLTVRTTISPLLQSHAERALRAGLLAYDRRHGWRGPLKHIDFERQDWQEEFGEFSPPAGTPAEWLLALVSETDEQAAYVQIQGGGTGIIPLQALKWARTQLDTEQLEKQRLAKGALAEELLVEIGRIDEADALRRRSALGSVVQRPSDVVRAGDVVLVSPLLLPAEDSAEDSAGDSAENEEKYRKNSLDEAGLPAESAEPHFALEQLPEIDGGLVALDPHTGRVLAMAGGWSFKRSQYNRATQAWRQPGSAFKPVVYLAALEQGFTPATRILDAPVVLDRGAKRESWKPGNYSRRYYGPSSMRIGIERSRNLMTIRLAEATGIDSIGDAAMRLRVVDRFPPQLVNTLGALETTLLRLSTAYAMLNNGGRLITPSLIDQVQDRNGKTLFKHDKRPCAECNTPYHEKSTVPEIPDIRPLATDEASAYQVVSMMEGVVRRGTAAQVGRRLKHPLAGKTGTTNNGIDTWFVGFSPDLVCGVFIGFDQPRSLGMRTEFVQETGSTVAVPIFIDFMEAALIDQPVIPFRVPSQVRLVQINPDTGGLSQPGDERRIIEAFKPGTEPASTALGVLIGDGGERSIRQRQGETQSSPSAGAADTGNLGVGETPSGAEENLLHGFY